MIYEHSATCNPQLFPHRDEKRRERMDRAIFCQDSLSIEILLINRQIYNEALPVIYSKMRFYAVVGLANESTSKSVQKDIRRFRSLPGFEHIRYFNIYVQLKPFVFAEGRPEGISAYSDYLKKDIAFVSETLACAPALERVEISWYDQLVCKYFSSQNTYHLIQRTHSFSSYAGPRIGDPS